MDNQSREKAIEIMKLLNRNTVTPEEMNSAVLSVIEAVKDTLKESKVLAKQGEDYLKEAVDYLDREHDLLKKHVSSEFTKSKKELQKETKKHIAELLDLIEEVKNLEFKDGEDGIDGIDGKDADEEKIIESVLSKIPKDEEDVIDKVNKSKKLIDAERIKGLLEYINKSIISTSSNYTGYRFPDIYSNGVLSKGNVSKLNFVGATVATENDMTTVTITGGGGSTVKVSYTDTIASYLGDKLINRDDTIKFNIEDGGLNERLSVMVDTTVDMNWQTDQTFASTGGILLPMGVTSERPSLTGYFRFNTESDSLEYLNMEMSWQEIATTTSLSGYIPIAGLSTGANLNSQTVSNIGAMTITPASLTGASATSAISLTQTWNTTGNPTANFMNITNTASGASALLADWQVGGVSQFNVSKGGILTSRASIVVTAGGVQVASGNSLTFASRSRINSLADGNILLWNQAQTSFSLLQLGGTTSSFPALKRSGTGIISRLADDSADAPFTASNLISTGVVRLKGYTVATLPAGTQGDVAFVTDALAPTFLTAITGGGAIVTPVFYNGTAWVAH